MRWFDELQHRSMLPEVALASSQARAVIDVTAFAGASGTIPPTAELTSRELDVLRLVALGCSNEDSGSQLSMSTRTVERHLSNIYAKLSITGKSARAAAAARLPELERYPIRG